jgi:hypothetical protein
MCPDSGILVVAISGADYRGRVPRFTRNGRPTLSADRLVLGHRAGDERDIEKIGHGVVGINESGPKKCAESGDRDHHATTQTDRG